MSDVVAYGVTSRFLTESATQPIKGAIFEGEAYSAEDYLKNPKFDWDSVKDEIELYKNLNLTKTQRNLLDIEDKLDQRSRVLKDTEYTVDNALDLDKIIINTKAVLEVHRVLKDAVDKEDAESVTRGGRVESASERGDI